MYRCSYDATNIALRHECIKPHIQTQESTRKRSLGQFYSKNFADFSTHYNLNECWLRRTLNSLVFNKRSLRYLPRCAVFVCVVHVVSSMNERTPRRMSYVKLIKFILFFLFFVLFWVLLFVVGVPNAIVIAEFIVVLSILPTFDCLSSITHWKIPNPTHFRLNRENSTIIYM